jgi:hypothetical protein
VSERGYRVSPDQAADRREAGVTGGLFNEFIERVESKFIERVDIKDITALFEILEFIDLFECREFYFP